MQALVNPDSSENIKVSYTLPVDFNSTIETAKDLICFKMVTVDGYLFKTADFEEISVLITDMSVGDEKKVTFTAITGSEHDVIELETTLLLVIRTILDSLAISLDVCLMMGGYDIKSTKFENRQNTFLVTGQTNLAVIIAKMINPDYGMLFSYEWGVRDQVINGKPVVVRIQQHNHDYNIIDVYSVESTKNHLNKEIEKLNFDLKLISTI